jgi:hypothetical protein
MKLSTTFSLVALLMTASVPAFAGSFTAGCTKEPQSAWKPTSAIESKAIAEGYSVSKTKTTGTCYEVYASKGNSRFELFYNPVDATLVHTQAK